MNLQDAGVSVHERVRTVLQGLSRSRTEGRALAQRATIVLGSLEGLSHAEQGRRLGIDRQSARRWAYRWKQANERLSAAANGATKDRDLRRMVSHALSDAHRSGTPPKFTAEQQVQLIALACERPESSNIPVNRLTPAELAREAVKRGIVESISPRHLDRILKRG